MEFFAAPPGLRELKQRFAAAGLTGFPPAYQVVVRCSAYHDHLVSQAYETHRVLGAGAGPK